MTLTIIEGINSAIGAATFFAIIYAGLRFSAWVGRQDARTTNLEGWFKSHTENHPGPTK